jgi:hypothetical protein
MPGPMADVGMQYKVPETGTPQAWASQVLNQIWLP